MTTRNELLGKAAHCYMLAQMSDDACRLYQRLQDYSAAANLHASAGRWRQAAACYGQTGQWQEAADAHEHAEEWEAAAEAWLRAGRRLRAAWLFADRADQPQRARALLTDLSPEKSIGQHAVAVILARCEAQLGEHERAGRRLHRTLAQLYRAGGDHTTDRIASWARRVAECLERWDLVMLCHAAAWQAHRPFAEKHWQEDAGRLFGDTSGIPLNPYGHGENNGQIQDPPLG
ncbi:MAG: hypothetical protein QNK37_33890 [Acidobacteriota bacterium]|nr:hypothetical protein [Acidobacteriota bacterium]